MTSPEIIPRAEAGLKPPVAPLTPMASVEGWYVHYVGSDLPSWPTLQQSVATMASLQAQAEAGEHGDKYIDFPYSFAVDPCGRIFEGRGWDFQAGATLNHNTNSWAVVYLGGPNTPLTDEARAAILELVQAGALRKPLCSYVRAHSDVFPTACPGDQLRQYVPFLNAHLHDPSTPSAPPIDWHAIVELAAWQKRVAANPLTLGADRPLDTKTLIDLLVAKKYMDPKPGGNDGVYGPVVARAVRKLKAADHLSNEDGTNFGGDAAYAILKP